MKIIRFIGFLICLFITFNTPASPRDTIPVLPHHTKWYVGAYYAGNTGLLTIHGGYELFHEKFRIGGGYGYLPEAVNGVSVHTLVIRTQWVVSKGLIYKKANYYLGLNTFYSFTNTTYLKFPAYYPDDYYNQNALHLAPHFGLSVPINLTPTWARAAYFHLELGTLDKYIEYAWENESIYPWDICNLSFGLNFHI